MIYSLLIAVPKLSSTPSRTVSYRLFPKPFCFNLSSCLADSVRAVSFTLDLLLSLFSLPISVNLVHPTVISVSFFFMVISRHAFFNSTTSIPFSGVTKKTLLWSQSKRVFIAVDAMFDLWWTCASYAISFCLSLACNGFCQSDPHLSTSTVYDLALRLTRIPSIFAFLISFWPFVHCTCCLYRADQYLFTTFWSSSHRLGFLQIYTYPICSALVFFSFWSSFVSLVCGGLRFSESN